jgi:hypothetical protein
MVPEVRHSKRGGRFEAAQHDDALHFIGDLAAHNRPIRDFAGFVDGEVHDIDIVGVGLVTGEAKTGKSARIVIRALVIRIGNDAAPGQGGEIVAAGLMSENSGSASSDRIPTMRRAARR